MHRKFGKAALNAFSKDLDLGKKLSASLSSEHLLILIGVSIKVGGYFEASKRLIFICSSTRPSKSRLTPTLRASLVFNWNAILN